MKMLEKSARLAISVFALCGGALALTDNGIPVIQNNTTVSPANTVVVGDVDITSTSSAPGILFRTGNKDQAWITSAGYVGIGINAPNAPLQIHSTNYKNLRLTTGNLDSDVSIVGRPTKSGNVVFNSFGKDVPAELPPSGFRWTIGDADVAPYGKELAKLYEAGNLTNLFLRGTTGAALRFFEGAAERVTLRSDATPGDFSVQVGGTTTTGPSERLRVRANGRIGIGTSDPDRTVHIFSQEANENPYLLIERPDQSKEVGIELRSKGTTPTRFFMWIDDGTKDFKMEFSDGNEPGLAGENDPTPRLMLPGKNKDIIACMSGGNFVIGNAVSVPNNRLLVDGNTKVNGIVTAQSIRTTKWEIATPDYVFEKGYDLKPLEKVESFVNKNKHLPEVPSAKELSEKGMDIAEMNLVLLKKVEELTLHAIRQEKELKRQAEEIRGMKGNRK